MRFDRDMVGYFDSNSDVKATPESPKGDPLLTAIYVTLSSQVPVMGWRAPDETEFYYAHCKFTRGFKPELMFRFAWALRVIRSMFSSDSRIIFETWLMVFALAELENRHQYRFCLGFARLWYWITKYRFKSAFKLMMSDMTSPGHPLAAHFEFEIRGL